MNYVDYTEYLYDSNDEFIIHDTYCGHFEITNKYNIQFYKMMLYMMFIVNAYHKRNNNYY